MELKEYLASVKGRGFLATADDQGKVDVAVYAKPHFMEDGTIAFITTERLTHHNLESNPRAAYLFMETAPGYKGVRLFLTKVREEKNSDLLYSLRRRTYPNEKNLYLVFFEIDKELPLIGPGEEPDEAQIAGAS